MNVIVNYYLLATTYNKKKKLVVYYNALIKSHMEIMINANLK